MADLAHDVAAAAGLARSLGLSSRWRRRSATGASTPSPTTWRRISTSRGSSRPRDSAIDIGYASHGISLLAGKAFAARPPSHAKKPCNVLDLSALQSGSCRPEPHKNREFRTTGTGNICTSLGRIRERTGGGGEAAKLDALRLQRPRFRAHRWRAAFLAARRERLDRLRRDGRGDARRPRRARRGASRLRRAHRGGAMARSTAVGRVKAMDRNPTLDSCVDVRSRR